MAKIYTDACLYNRNGGIGVFCETGEIKSTHIKRNVPGMTTQTLEADAVWEAICRSNHLKNVTIFTDSLNVYDCLVTNVHRYEANGWLTTKNTPVHAASILRSCYKALEKYRCQGKNIRVEYVKGHSGIIGNVQADRLAGLAAGKPCSSEILQSPTFLSNNVASNIVKQKTITIDSINENSMPPKKKLIQLPIAPLVAAPQQSSFWSPFSQTIEVIDTVPKSAQFPFSVKDRVSKIDISAIESPIKEETIPFEESGEVSNWGLSTKKLKKNKLIKDQSTQTESLESNSIIQEIDTNLIDSTIYWIAPYKMSEYDKDIDLEIHDDIDDALSIGDHQEKAQKNVPDEWKLFLSCIECAESILVIYPKSHEIATDLKVHLDTTFALTKCRECITNSSISRVPSTRGVNVELESNTLNDYFENMKMSTRVIKGSTAHIAACKIADTSVPILSTNGSVKFASILTVTKLCGRGTRSLAVNVDKMELFGYLENGFL